LRSTCSTFFPGEYGGSGGQGADGFLSSHQIHEVERVADWIAILHQGKLQVVSSLEDLKTNTTRLSFSMRDTLIARNTKTISPFVSIRCNLWKDARQILTVILAVIGAVTLIQLTFLAARFLVDGPMTWNSLIETTLTLAGVGSLLTIIGSAAMMIGYERQTGTWVWASSLPASWAQTAASKLIVSFASSILVGLALCCVPLAVQ
jgi:hypothetical protein